jgi:hypothetical protein
MSEAGSHDNNRLYPPVLQGREAYREFASSAKSDLRYFRSSQGQKFLDAVIASHHVRKDVIPPGTTRWRARLGCILEDAIIADGKTQIWAPEDRPFPADKMGAPPANKTTEGRVNPRGIPYLYLANNWTTAVAEIRPWIGAKVSVGEFVTKRPLTIIDCSKYHDGIHGVIRSGVDGSYDDGVWSAIDEAFAKPVDQNEDRSDYIPTQILGELFKTKSFDGVVYKSRLDDDGVNVVLFHPGNAELVSCSLFEVKNIKFDCVDQQCTYHV